ncbi:MAG TPA: hypothetical protein VK196_14015 [Magnetospirillum sp.]|nr:hypothetical protein [Magnetospirillum sp.]
MSQVSLQGLQSRRLRSLAGVGQCALMVMALSACSSLDGMFSSGSGPAPAQTILTDGGHAVAGPRR